MRFVQLDSLCGLAGHAAVVFSFVLSGYVLSLPFQTGRVSYPVFLITQE
jgi:hypothetical protein